MKSRAGLAALVAALWLVPRPAVPLDLGTTLNVNTTCGGALVSSGGSCVRAGVQGVPIMSDICGPGFDLLSGLTVGDAEKLLASRWGKRTPPPIFPLMSADHGWLDAVLRKSPEVDSAQLTIRHQFPARGTQQPVDQVYVQIAPIMKDDLTTMPFADARRLVEGYARGVRLHVQPEQASLSDAALMHARITSQSVPRGAPIPLAGVYVALKLPEVGELRRKMVSVARDSVEERRKDARLVPWPGSTVSELPGNARIIEQFPDKHAPIPNDGRIWVAVEMPKPAVCKVPAIDRLTTDMKQIPAVEGTRGCPIVTQAVVDPRARVGSIVGVFPGAGSEVPVDTTIRLLVAEAPPKPPDLQQPGIPPVVPPLGKCEVRLRAALPILKAARVGAFAARTGGGKSAPDDWVVEQVVRPDEGQSGQAETRRVALVTVPDDDPVCIVKPETVAVPQVESRDAVEASQSLVDAKLLPAGWQGGPSPVSGRVVAQRPPPGTLVAPGTRVELLIERAGCPGSCATDSPPQPQPPSANGLVAVTLGSGLAVGYGAAQVLRLRPRRRSDEDSPSSAPATDAPAARELPAGLGLRAVPDPRDLR